MNQFYFEGILKELKNKIHPETYHFRKGNHPGPEWYLKTVCPTPDLIQIDKYGYGALWWNISYENSEIIKLVQQAYDWYGNEIPYMNSVWVNKKYDIIISLDNNISSFGLEVVMIDRETGGEFYLDNLRELVSIGREDTKWEMNPTSYLTELDEINQVADAIESKLDVTHARKEFKIVEGGKKRKAKKKDD